MSLLLKIIRISAAAFFGFSAILLGGLLAFLLYTAYPGVGGILAASLFIPGGFYVGFMVFRTAKSRGILSFLTTVNASPDLDTLQVQQGGKTRKTDAATYTDAYKKDKHLFTGGSISHLGRLERKELREKKYHLRSSV